ncbi:hypothetical protein C8R45DRAFT_1138953 [Mycena sanguinolenta]|nr:hypothetical protein C8R45DRAFT_1138953 [Mycena sanguinolenta]
MSRYGLEKAPESLIAADQSNGPKQFKLWAFLSKLRGPPGIVVCGQLMLLIAAWGFFAAVQTQEFIALPQSTALWVKPIPILLHLFSWGVRQSITLRLRGEGISLADFISSVKISSRSLILDTQNGRWSAMSVAVLIVTVVQTSCWSALLTPGPIGFEVSLSGYEIDLMNSDLQSLRSTMLDYCVVNTRQTDIGYATLKGDIGLNASLTLMDQTFNVSTGGTLPQTFDDMNTSSWFVGTNITYIPSNIRSAVDIPEGLMFSTYTVSQRGFSANVSCEFQDLPADTTVQFSTAQDWSDSFPSIGNLTYYKMSSTCVPPAGSIPGDVRFSFRGLVLMREITVNSTGEFILDPPDYILMVACGGKSDAYTLIFHGVGRYSFMDTMVCTVVPKVTNVQVDYSDTGPINSTWLKDVAPAPITGPAGLTAVTTIYEMQSFAQGTRTNIVGDEIIAVVEEVDPIFSDSSVLSAVEEYIRGVTEYSGSILRACLSAPNGTFPEGVIEGSNMAVPTTGTLHGQIVGWLKISPDTCYVMIPGTLVAIATIWVVLVTLAYHSRDPQGGPFDPANTLHIVAASGAGGLQNVFTGTEATAMERVENVHVVLQSIAGRPPALYVQAGIV